MKIPENTRKLMALRAVEFIKQQAAEGKDIDGRSYHYSTNPFVRPVAGSVIPAASLKSLEKSGEVKLFHSGKTGGLWMLIVGGYKAYRGFTGRSTDSDFLLFTGNMLGSMTGQAIGDNSIKIGFTSPREAEKAFYLSISGAGRSHKLWRFFGLNNANLKRLLDEFAGQIVESPEIVNEVKKVFNDAGFKVS
jgi:hypothetical protein